MKPIPRSLLRAPKSKKWAATCALDPTPRCRPELHNRVADNWRVLFAIADDLGHGEEARVAAVALSAHRHDEDFGIALLIDIREGVYSVGADRISSLALKAQLVELDDSQWLDWRGPHDEKPPHEVQHQAAHHLVGEPLGVDVAIYSRNSTRHGRPIVRQPTRQHNVAESYGYCAREPTHRPTQDAYSRVIRAT